MKHIFRLFLMILLCIIIFQFAGILAWAEEVEINKTNFPDSVFRSYVSANCDSNEDGILNESEIAKVERLSINSLGISSLKGIEFFTSLTSLNCGGNQLGVLDLSHNTALISLGCGDNLLTSLDISNNADLISLGCGNNLLTSLDISHNVVLTELYCGDNMLTSLDISHNAALTELECQNNMLTSLNLNYNTSLTSLICDGNRLVSLDVRNNTALTTLYCYNNNLASLDLSTNTAIKKLNCNDNKLLNLDISNNTQLTSLSCGNNQLTSLFLDNNTELISLGCGNNLLTSLDVSNNTALKTLNCYHNQLTNLDLSNNTILNSLSCRNNHLTYLDISHNNALTFLDCTNNQLMSLDLSSCSGMWHLECYSNLIVSLDISNCPTLAFIVENVSPYNDGYTIRYGGQATSWGSNDKLLYCDKNVTLITDPENIVTIGFDKNAPDAEGEMISQSVNRGEEAILRACGFTRRGYIFTGWNTTKDGTGMPYSDAGTITITEPVYLYAQWREGYNITFDKNADDASGTMKPLRVYKGDKITLTSNSFYRSEYVFRGWNTDPNGKGEPYGNRAEFTPTEDMTLYAQWRNRLWIRYYSDDGESVINSISAAEGDTVTIRTISSLNYSAPTGMVLDEWNTAADGTGTPYKPGETVTLISDLNLFARWRDEILTPIDQTRFPDEAFRSYVSTNFDANGDGILSEAELANAKAISVMNKGVSSLKGIELFTNLSLLQCGSNQLISLDITMNTELTSLYCQTNQLTNLDVSHNPKLSYLSCGDNSLTSLDISNNHALTSLACANNQLSNLDISCATGLEALQCQRNNLTSLDISKCPSLTQLVSNTEPNTSSGFVRYGPYERMILSYDEGVTLITGTSPDLVLPASLTVIDEEAFSGGAFTYVKLPEGAISIGARAFADCPNLTYIYIPEDTNAIDVTAFSGVSELTIYGKSGSYAETYASAHNFTFAVVE